VRFPLPIRKIIYNFLKNHFIIQKIFYNFAAYLFYSFINFKTYFIMKKFLSIMLVLAVSIAAFGQKNVSTEKHQKGDFLSSFLTKKLQ
jgi:hypothetical protein